MLVHKGILCPRARKTVPDGTGKGAISGKKGGERSWLLFLIKASMIIICRPMVSQTIVSAPVDLIPIRRVNYAVFIIIS